MGRRRNKGMTRSAGAGRLCKHPARDREYRFGWPDTTDLIRCKRCGVEFANTEQNELFPPLKPGRPHP